MFVTAWIPCRCLQGSGYTQRTNYVIKIKLLPPTKVSVKPCIVQENIEHWNSAAYCQPHENWTNSKLNTAEQRERTYVYISSINCSKWRCCLVAINCLTPRQQTENTVFPTIKYEHHTWCVCPPQMDAVFVMAMLFKKNANSSRPPSTRSSKFGLKYKNMHSPALSQFKGVTISCKSHAIHRLRFLLQL